MNLKFIGDTRDYIFYYAKSPLSFASLAQVEYVVPKNWRKGKVVRRIFCLKYGYYQITEAFENNIRLTTTPPKKLGDYIFNLG